ncbi:DNA polymerase IV (plasmid) [Deinococcus proteolyticus MRP]|uniref:DNA polymerase IV n=1 Tax=Deinococcus proteolyticus (strain ATCC 35074 / DSM 20540 / JCM 6276 / NBRC 101906 / NCIMB 13154 / VKM Ac-1939 / CCM 2703 / MRP) TaxID=693977 RepID=F0RQT4_DEIPM|nr:DNA polymerase IV [Deinococcus proteolyticus]ADY27643.1 DNA polymerase IV [Deinococcus proteolyticus MRP]
MTPAPRKIIHIDMDAFYASVEQRDQPKLRGRPLAVAWGGRRSVVLTASYEARSYGVRSAMPLYRALNCCPQLQVVPPRFGAYREVSAQIREIFQSYTPLVEPLALDEAYLDVTDPQRGPRSATLIAGAIRAEVQARTGLSATAGVSVNKLLAKLASGLHKPDGLTVLLPDQADALLLGLPVGDFHGIGPATARKLQALGIASGADLRAADPHLLTAHFGKAGGHFWRIAHGQDDRPVLPDRPHKSVGSEETYGEDLRTLAAVRLRLPVLARLVQARLERAALAGRTVVLKLKFSDRRSVTRQLTLPAPVWQAADLERAAARLLTPQLLAGRPGVRLAGITVSGLRPAGELPLQPALFGPEGDTWGGAG